jgi:uncharacterized protein
MAKVLLLIGVVVVAILVLRNYRRALERDTSRPDETSDTTSVGTADMGRCARCGVHAPRAEGILSGGEFYCTEEHRRLGPAPR